MRQINYQHFFVAGTHEEPSPFIIIIIIIIIIVIITIIIGWYFEENFTFAYCYDKSQRL